MSSNTPRPSRYHLPMVTRHSDLRKLEQCPASWLLSHLHEGKPSVPMILGDLVHEAIEDTIRNGRDLESAVANLRNKAQEMGALIASNDPIETSRKSLDSMPNLAVRYLKTWWEMVHPDSGNRHDLFTEYRYPPRVERRYRRPASRITRYPTWCTIDAVFSGNDTLIVDWKSSVRDQKSDSQLHFYRYVSGLTDARAAYVNLHNGDIQIADPYPGDGWIEQRIKRAEQLKERLLHTRFPTQRRGWQCKWCPVQAECLEMDHRDYRKISRKLIPLQEIAA